jgi:hypothetical protein
MNHRKKKQYFLKDEYAVLGLPMRLTVSLIIGAIALLAILSFIMNPCVFPHKMHVSITPLVTTVQGSEPENVSFMVVVCDTDGVPLRGASVIITGLGGAGSGFSNEDGRTSVHLQVWLEDGLYEGYLAISVKASCHVAFEQQEMIKVVKGSP